MMISLAMQKCFRMGIKVYPVIKNERLYIQTLLPDKTTQTEKTPTTSEQAGIDMSKKYIEYAKKFNP